MYVLCYQLYQLCCFVYGSIYIEENHQHTAFHSLQSTLASGNTFHAPNSPLKKRVQILSALRNCQIEVKWFIQFWITRK